MNHYATQPEHRHIRTLHVRGLDWLGFYHDSACQNMGDAKREMNTLHAQGRSRLVRIVSIQCCTGKEHVVRKLER